jgi:hypothetical protein
MLRGVQSMPRQGTLTSPQLRLDDLYLANIFFGVVKKEGKAVEGLGNLFVIFLPGPLYFIDYLVTNE